MKIKINKDILIWAREELNLSQEIVANKMGRKLEDVQAWENGNTTSERFRDITRIKKYKAYIFRTY